MERFFSPNSGEDQKKRSSPKIERFFSPNSGKDLRSDAHQSQIIGGMLMKTILKLLGGGTVKLMGGVYPPWFWHPCLLCIFIFLSLYSAKTLTIGRSYAFNCSDCTSCLDESALA